METTILLNVEVTFVSFRKDNFNLKIMANIPPLPTLSGPRSEKEFELDRKLPK